MVFSSIIFIFLFLPLTILGYFLIGRRFRNAFLFCASLLFYAWGETFYLLIMLVSISGNYVAGRVIEHNRQSRLAKLYLGLAIGLNVGLLSVFKYANFLVDNLNLALEAVRLPVVALDPVHLPIGISFFTFQAMSYVIDVYRNQAPVQKNPVNIGLYIALFPQLIAGPIVRYHNIAAQIARRRVRLDDIGYGIERFTFGLGKKMLIANQVAIVADQIFALPATGLTPAMAWLGVLCYSLQIYYDFSGYSDMAIGLGRIFGFHFLENFNYPYISKSIREFWRRWHISLSTWFRDYLYIPLGGNRGKTYRTYANLLIVFFLCGLWHGASWNFIIWGLLHGLFLVVERIGFEKLLQRCWAPLRHAYVLLVVGTAWVFFRAETLPDALDYLTVMSGLATTAVPEYIQVEKDIYYSIAAGILFSAPVFRILSDTVARFTAHSHGVTAAIWDGTAGIIKIASMAFILFASLLFLSSGAYNPFIYFRF